MSKILKNTLKQPTEKMSAIFTYSFARAFKKTYEVNHNSSFVRILLNKNLIQAFHKEVIYNEDVSDDDYSTSKFNKRGAYVNSSSKKWNSRSFDSAKGKYNDSNYKKYPSYERNFRNDWYKEKNQVFPRMSNINKYPLERPPTKVEYDESVQIEKNFYVEHVDVTERSEEDIQRYRSSFNINVNGSNIPKPITKFNELVLPESLMTSVNNLGYGSPTPIQAQGWPIALSGRDMIGISQTGSGKTLVFMLPAVVHALNQENVVSSNSTHTRCKPQVLVLAPTRELVHQIHDTSNAFVYASGLNSACAYGGASKRMQLQCLTGAEICIATPGRLIDFTSEGFVSLANVTYLVLDEADRMLDMGFEPQIRMIVDQIRPDRQTLMWSATWPRSIQNLAEDFLTQYVKVTIGNDELSANPNIKQNIYVLEEWDKKQRLITLLEDILRENDGKVLIFAQMKKTVDFLYHFLNNNNLRALCIHGDISQNQRDFVVQRFRKENSCVLIATDIAARGLDITGVSNVVIFDFPTCIEDYIHRIGRTARGNNTGISHAFFTPEDAGLAKDIIATLKKTDQDIDPKLFSMCESTRKEKKRNYFSKNMGMERKQHVSSWM